MSSRHHHPSLGLSASCRPAALLHPPWPRFPAPAHAQRREVHAVCSLYPSRPGGLSWGFIQAEARVLCFALGLLLFFLTFIAEETQLYFSFSTMPGESTPYLSGPGWFSACALPLSCVSEQSGRVASCPRQTGDARVVGSSVVRTGGNPVCVGGGENVEPSSGNPQPPCMKWDVLTFEASACGF